MVRPALEIGTWGTIKRTPVLRVKVEQSNGKYKYRDQTLIKHEDGKFYLKTDTAFTTPVKPTGHVARARYRDSDGATRLVEAWGTSGAAAERNLVANMNDRAEPSAGGDISRNSTIEQLWTAYEAYLIKDGRSLKTMDTYRPIAVILIEKLGRVRLYEATTQRLGRVVDGMAETSPGSAKQARSVLSGMFKYAIRQGALVANPVREVQTARVTPKPKPTMTVEDLRAVLTAVRSSKLPLPPMKAAAVQESRMTVGDYCKSVDIADPIYFLTGTGVRISEALALRWSDLDLEAGTADIAGHVVAAKGMGVVWVEGGKSVAGERTLPLPQFVVDMLIERKKAARPNDFDVVFPSQSDTLRDPNGLRKQWRRVREVIGYDGVSPHHFRRALATMLDDQGITARVAADQLGHSKVSMTQDVYMARGRVHSVVADVIDKAITQSVG